MLFEALTPYAFSVYMLGTMGGMLLVQLLVADLAGIKAKHKPGSPLEYQPDSFYFRASRAIGNTNESIAAFVLLMLFGVLLAADPLWLNRMAGLYVAGRLAHMLCYWANWPLARSISFTVALVALLGLAVVGVLAC